MPALSPSQLAAYAALFDFRSQIVKAAVQLLSSYGLNAYGPGQGVQKLGRHFISVDFQRGAFTENTKLPLIQDLGAGRNRSSMYCEFTGTLSLMNSVPFETDEKTQEQYLTEDHVRELDQVTAQQLAIFMEPLQPFTSANLPWLDVMQIRPIEPDDRPPSEREVNASFNRFALVVSIRPGAWPDVA